MSSCTAFTLARPVVALISSPVIAGTQVFLTLEPTDYKLASALIVLIALLVPAVRGRLRLRAFRRLGRESAGKAGNP